MRTERAAPEPPGHRAAGSGDAFDLSDACRRVLGHLAKVRAPQTPEQIHHGTGLGLLEIADAVEVLFDRALITVEREVDEMIRLADGGGHAG